MAREPLRNKSDISLRMGKIKKFISGKNTITEHFLEKHRKVHSFGK